MRTVLGGIAILILLGAFTVQVSGANPPEYSMLVGNGKVSVTISLTIRQNLTLFEKSFLLPQFHGVLQGGNSSGLAVSLSDALAKKAPNAQVDLATLKAGSSVWSNTTNVQWLNVSLTMDVSGVWRDRGSAAWVDLSWKSFAVPSSLVVGGAEVNNIGSRYLLGVASDLAGQSTTSLVTSSSYMVNGRTVSPVSFTEDVGKLSTLNFSSLATPVQNWRFTYMPFAANSKWALDPAQTLGMEFIQVFQEPGQPSGFVRYGVFYSLDGEVVVPSTSSAQGDTVILTVSNQPEILMIGIILSSALVGSVMLFSERRLVRPLSWKKRKKG